MKTLILALLAVPLGHLCFRGLAWFIAWCIPEGHMKRLLTRRIGSRRSTEAGQDIGGVSSATLGARFREIGHNSTATRE